MRPLQQNIETPDDDDCPKTDAYERMIDRADYLRDEEKDRRWEAWHAKKQELAAKRDQEREAQP